MVLSINTSSAIFSALRNLTSSTTSLNKTNNEISSGYKVGSSKDDAATFAIATKLRGEVLGLNAVKNSLNRATSTSDVALAAGSSISTLLIELKEKAVAAADTGLDSASRAALNTDFTQLRDQISNIVGSASFSGTNILDDSGATITAITATDGTSTVTIPSQDLSLGGPNVTLSDTQGIATAAEASAALDAITASLDNVSAALSEIGAGADSISRAQEFAELLSNKIEVGVGNLVDSNIASARANQIAGQIKQQLGIQTLSIINNSRKSILSLFR